MRGIVRAAAYLPRWTYDGRRVAGPDEDEFTLAATAVERLRAHDEDDPMPARIFLVGNVPPSAEANLARFVGSPVKTDRFDGGDVALRSALRAALDPALGTDPVGVVAVDLTARGEGAVSSRFSDAGVALRVAEGAAIDATTLPSRPTDPPASATSALFEHARNLPTSERGLWVGDWVENPSLGIPLVGSAVERAPTLGTGPVSQGAYVPRPRYLENLPSRWWFAADRCGACGAVTFPSRGRCRGCGRRDGLRTVRLPRDGGTVVAATVIGPGGQPTEFDAQAAASGPYGVVLVELAPGARATLQVTDSLDGQVTIGQRVSTRLRRLYPLEGEWRYGRKAVTDLADPGEFAGR